MTTDAGYCIQRVATLASIALGGADESTVALLEGLASEASAITDETLQMGAVECLQVLARA